MKTLYQMKYPESDAWIIYDAKHTVAIGLTATDAGDIIRICNAHDELVAALQSLVEFWDNGTPVRPGSDVATDARAALAKATKPQA